MIHSYSLNGYNIVLDVHSGAVHVVDDCLYQLINMIGDIEAAQLPENCPQDIAEKLSAQFSAQEIEGAFSDIHELVEAGQLYTADEYEKFSGMMRPSPIKAMCLHIAHDCNLRCCYCFASTGDFGGARVRMSAEVGKKAIDYLIEKSQNRHNLEVDFFGGEPTMNFEVVKEVVEYARSLEEKHNKNFRFTITTNGLLLDDDKIDFINKEMSNVVLSIDGRKEVTDRVRSRVNGDGCYDTIMPKFKRSVEKRGHDQYYVRGTFTKYNKDFAEDVLHLAREGFDQISVEPVVADPAMPYALTEEDLPEVFAEYERLAKELLELGRQGKGVNFFHFMLDLDQGPCAIKRLRGCGCGNEYCAITPDGEVYPCHQFVGHPEWLMGTLEKGDFDAEKQEMFAKATVYGKEECSKCWAKFYCSGGCNANNMLYAGDVHKPFKVACEMEKKRLECAIMIKAAEADME
ncbi:MAG: thioether cross-link-forming SCIFF peptide maturase [Oscillospiraceae bacterium]|nr:thioether cross-link-forming SCIFF peptide maturase [Oscillospiraceae bacterium]